ncbi:hypothetical protein, partial [Aeromonas diversa]|uniref:hypothetical protein n=1 Tax=Aeromonas diversa TaxID=502790 RepID=UPI003462A2AB
WEGLFALPHLATWWRRTAEGRRAAPSTSATGAAATPPLNREARSKDRAVSYGLFSAEVSEIGFFFVLP